jgi:hypothetical protein
LKRAWTPFWRSVSALLLLPTCVPAQAQLRDASAKNHAAPEAVDPHRNDELTLAGLRPGRDAMAKALRLFAKGPAIGEGGVSRTWRDDCRHGLLSIIGDDNGTILEIRVAETSVETRAEAKHGCAHSAASRWVTGHGLMVGDSCSRVLALYGQPGSRGPSTKGGQQLELFYYAFDWAGPDVPQVMTVLCTPEKEEKHARVVEITLAAPSL